MPPISCRRYISNLSMPPSLSCKSPPLTPFFYSRPNPDLVGKLSFAFFSQLYKVDPLIWTVWTGALRRGPPHLLLWLMRWPDEAVNNLLKEAMSRGIGRGSITFAPPYPEKDHLLIKAAADLALDTPVYGAHTTLADLLWAGVPSISLPLDHMATRIGTSLLHSLDGRKQESRRKVQGMQVPPKTGGTHFKFLDVSTHKEYEDRLVELQVD